MLTKINYTKFIYSTLIFVGLLFFIYVYLGGLNKPKVELVDVSDYDLVGVVFEGDYKHEQLEKNFLAMRHYLETKQIDGVLTVVNYTHAQEEEGIVRQFIGILYDKEPTYVPGSLNKLIIPAKQALRIEINSNYLVMPSPEEIKKSAKHYAKVHGLELQNLSIEKYFPKEGFYVEFPLVVK